MIFGQNYMEFDGCRGNIKSDGHTISKFPQRANEPLGFGIHLPPRPRDKPPKMPFTGVDLS